jgi:hypothetical protein
MYRIKYDDNLNRVSVWFEGLVSEDQTGGFYREFKGILSKTKKGFVVVTDLSLLHKMDEGAKVYIEKTMDECNKKGVSKIIRIIPDPSKDIGFSIMSLFHYPKDVVIHTFESIEQAQQQLKI